MDATVAHSATAHKAEHTTSMRRDQLIDATITAISRFGLSNTTLAKVAKLADMTPGIVNFYFKTKEQLLLETLKFLAAEYHQLVIAGVNTKDQPLRVLIKLIDASFNDRLLDPRKACVWYSFWGESQARKEYMRICGDLDTELHQLIRDQFERLCANPNYQRLNPKALARGLEGLIDGYWQELLYEPENFDAEDAKETCHAYLESLFFKTDSDKLSGATNVSTFEKSDLLAPWTYQNQEFFDLEIEHLFKKNWLLAGHISDVLNKGDYVAFDAVGERALVIRGDDNHLRAFHNVCRHRGGRVVKENHGTCKRAIVCPFHGWTYRLDGSLKNIPAASTFGELNKSEHGLVELEMEIWFGFIFVRFNGNGPSIKETMQPIAHKLVPYRLEELQPCGEPWKEVRPYNWKVVHDIDNEGYHVPIGHPSLQQLYGQNYEDRLEHGIGCSYGYLNEKPGTIWSVKHYQNILPRFDHLPEENQRLWFYVAVFPNLVFSFCPDLVEIYMTLPKSVEQTEFLSRSYALSDDRREVKIARYLNERINRETDKEDESFVSWIQEGMKSSAFPKPVLSDKELGVRDFHKRIQALLPVANLANAPQTGKVSQANAECLGKRLFS